MEHTTSKLLQRLSESATIAMSRKARELKDQGIDVISLSLGEPDFDTPDAMKQAGIDAIEANETHYTPVPGTPRVRKAIVEKFKRDNGLTYSMDEVVVSTGAKQSLANVVLSLVDPGDEVILPAPFWVSYEELVKVAGGTPVILPTSIDNDYKVQPEALGSRHHRQNAIGDVLLPLQPLRLRLHPRRNGRLGRRPPQARPHHHRQR